MPGPRSLLGGVCMPGPSSLLGVWVYKRGGVGIPGGIPEESILGGGAYTGGRYTRYTPLPPPVLTSNDGHRSGQYTSYWNVF